MAAFALFLILLFTSFLSFFVCITGVDFLCDAYASVAFFPLAFSVAVAPLSFVALDQSAKWCRLTIFFYVVLQWLRAVVLPATGVASGYFDEYVFGATSESLSTACVLFFVELLVSSAICYVLPRLFRSKAFESESALRLELSGSVVAYGILIALAAILFIRYGRNAYSFLVLAANSTARASMTDSLTDGPIGMIISYGMSFFVILVSYFCFKRYRGTRKRRYVLFAALIVCLRISIISTSSESRFAVLCTLIAFSAVLCRLFPRQKRKILIGVVGVGVLVVGLMTVYKVFKVFLHESYFDAFVSGAGDFDLYSISSLININLYGVREISLNVAVANNMDLSLNTFLYDFVRNTFGVHYLVKDVAHTTTELYNLQLYGGSSSAGHLYSAVCYGYGYLGLVFAPLFTAVNILFACKLECLTKSTDSIEKCFVFGSVYSRFAVMMFCSTPMVWNYASRILIVGLTVVYLAQLLKRAPWKRPGLGISRTCGGNVSSVKNTHWELDSYER